MQEQPGTHARPALKGVGRNHDTWLGFGEDVGSSTRWPKELKNSSKDASGPSAPGAVGNPSENGRAVSVVTRAVMLRKRYGGSEMLQKTVMEKSNRLWTW